MIEAWWRSLKHQWLFLHSLDSAATVRRLVAFYVSEHNRVMVGECAVKMNVLMRTVTRCLLVAVLWSVMCAHSVGQSNDKGLSDMLGAFASQAFEEREAAAYRAADILAGDPGLARSFGFQDAVIKLLTGENASLRERYRNGVSSEDAFGDYYFVVQELAFDVLKEMPASARRDAMIVTLAKSAFNPDSAVERLLATFGDKAIDAAIDLTGNAEGLLRERGYSLLRTVGQEVERGSVKEPVSRRAESLARRQLVVGLRDSDAVVRRQCVEAAQAWHDRASLPLLKHLSKHDPDEGLYSVKRLAVKPIAAIEESPVKP